MGTSTFVNLQPDCPPANLGRMGTVARAYELARSGQISSIEELKRQLRREGEESVLAHVQGSLSRELCKLINESRSRIDRA